MRKYVIIMFVILSMSLLLASTVTRVTAQEDIDNDGILDTKEQLLADTYAPILHFVSGEEFFPTDPNYHIENSVLYMKVDDFNTLIDSSPTSSSISQYTTEDYFLNNTLGGFEEIAQDYTQSRENYGDQIYAHITSEAQYTVIQYWFFYAFNPGTLNQHQGDWEMIEIVLDSTETPIYAAYSQHQAGEMAEWKDVEIVDDTHPRVYVALGSHANYFRSYQGKLGMESDIVGNDFALKPEDLEIVTLGEKGIGNHPASQDWLDFGGRWGNWDKIVDAYIGSAGPNGPGQGENMEKWFNPVSWGSEKLLVDQNWFTGSLFVYYFLYIFAAILAVRVAYKIWKILKRKKKGKLNIMQILRSKAAIGVILGIMGVIVYLVALFMPWYVVTGDVQTTMLETAGSTELVLIDGINGVRVNTLQNDQGLATLFGIGIPFSIIFLSSVVLLALDIIVIEKPKELSRTYIISGITSLIPVIIIVIFIVALTGVINAFAGALSGGQPLPQQVTDMVSAMSSSPFSGGYTDTIYGQGSVAINWGLGVGSYLFIVAAAIKITAGVLLRQTKVPESDEK